MSNTSIWPIDKTLSGAATSDQSGPENNGDEGVLHIPQIHNIPRASQSDGIVSYEGQTLEEFYLSPEMESVYSIATTD